MRFPIRPLAFVLLGLLPLLAQAEMSGKDIMQAQKQRHETRDEESRAVMRLIDDAGKATEREMVNYSLREDDGTTRALIKFLAPADIRDVGLLTWERGAAGDDQWLYLPALRNVKRIAAGGKKNKFMGSDLAFEDMRPENLETHAYNLIKSEDYDGQSCYVVEITPATDEEKSDSGYSKRVVWVRKDILFTVKTEYYDTHDRLVKTALISNLNNIRDQMWRSSKTVVQDLISHHKTEIETNKRVMDQNLDADFFTERSLTKPTR
ncbi:outer membrane lipoprotein-sorting protein [Methylomagnum sp.]